MGSLGAIEVLTADTSFGGEPTRPVLPGTGKTFAATTNGRRSGRAESATASFEAGIELTLANAREQVKAVRSSTTLASLAHALETVGDLEQAAAIAREALELTSRSAVGRLLDPVGARVALEVLLRAGGADEAFSRAMELPIGPHALLMVGAALATMGRLDDARTLIDRADIPERDAVLGFLLTVEAKDDKAVPLLRSALRFAPDDADSAHNLSIGLWRLGSRRKAISAALQAVRSAPAREDIALHYFELLLIDQQFERVDREISLLLQAGVEASARMFITHARAKLGMREFARAHATLERAGVAAADEGDMATLAEVESNLIRLRASSDRISREDAFKRLVKLSVKYPKSNAVVANLAQVTYRKEHAASLRRAFDLLPDDLPAPRAAFIRFQLATLEGDNAAAADFAVEWFTSEPDNAYAISAALVALGIGAERWSEATRIASTALSNDRRDLRIVNNAAYVLAMAGNPSRAIEVLEALDDRDYVLDATLGLAYLAAGQVEAGMKKYRQAADDAEKQSSESRSLMTAYQALVLRQLHLLSSSDNGHIVATSLAPVPLPDDWRDSPEFLRLYSIAMRKGYDWPLSI